MTKKMIKHKVNIIIVTWNSTNTLQGLLESIHPLGEIEMRIIIADNNSLDRSILRDIINNYKKIHEIIYIENNENLGYAGGNNAAKKYLDDNNLDGDILIINPDCVLDKNSIFNTVTEVEKYTQVAGAMIKTLSPSGDVVYNSLKLEGYNHRFKIINTMASSIETDYLAGSFLYLKRQALKDIQLFNSDYFMYWEEADLSLRLRSKGWRIISINNSHIFRRDNPNDLKSKAIYYYNRNAIKIITKPYFHGNLLGLTLFLFKNFMASMIASCRLKSYIPLLEYFCGVFDGIKNVHGKCLRHN